MSILNKKTCADSNGNTGFGGCFFDLKEFRGAHIIPQSFSLTKEQLASKETVKAALEAATLEAKSLRLYPIHKFVGVENTSTDATLQTLGYGTEITLNDGKYKLTFQYLEGGMCLNKALRKFNQSSGSLAVLFYDAAGQLIGFRDGDSLKGIPLDSIYAPKMTPNDYANTAQYRISFAFDPVYLNDKFGIVEGGDFTFWESIKGISDVALSADKDDTVITATASSGCAEVSMYELYADELASPDAWVVRNAATGAEITITTVAKDDAAQGWTITLASNVPVVTLSMATPDELDNLDVSKYESNVITVINTGS